MKLFYVLIWGVGLFFFGLNFIVSDLDFDIYFLAFEPIVGFVYYLFSKHKPNKKILNFLLLYSASNFFLIFTFYINNYFFPLISNLIFLFSLIVLTNYILSSFDYNKSIKKRILPILIFVFLAVFKSFLFYSLNDIYGHENKFLDNCILILDFVLDLYFIVVLCLTFLYYLEKQNVKSSMMFLGFLVLLISDLNYLGFYRVENLLIFKYIADLFLIVGFNFLITSFMLPNKRPKAVYY